MKQYELCLPVWLGVGGLTSWKNKSANCVFPLDIFVYDFMHFFSMFLGVS